MSRRKKSSPVEDLIDLVAMLPWWAGCAIAVVAYAVLHRYATQTVVLGTQPSQLADAAVKTIWTTLARIGQYVLPCLCLLGAAISAWRRRTRLTLVANVSHSKAADALDGMSWSEFELLVGESFRMQGYRVTETGGGGADGGIDLELRKGDEKFLVQCKQWKAFKVGVEVVRELFGVMAARGATGGFVVTSGTFTADAKSFASGRNVTLIDGPALHSRIVQVTGARAAPVATSAERTERSSTAQDLSPLCPMCAKPMIQRTAKLGKNAGRVFWGCASFPSCRGTRPID